MGCNGLLKLQCSLRACAWLGWSWTLAWEPVQWHYLLMHPCVPAPQLPRLWELVLLVGKSLRGERRLSGTLCTPRPVQQVPNC